MSDAMAMGAEGQTNTVRRGELFWIALAEAAELLTSDPASAHKQASEILTVIPGQPHALTLATCARKAKGEFTGLRAMLDSLAAERPDLATAHWELGALLARQGDAEGAVRALSRAVELEPNHPEAWRVLADALVDAGQMERAADAYIKHFELSVAELQTLEQAVALDEDEPEITEKVLREFLRMHPTDVAAAQMFGNLAIRHHLFEDAERILARALELAPDFEAALADYQDLLQRRSKWNELLAVFDRRIEQVPDNALYRFRKAAVLTRLGEHLPALTLYEGLLREFPDEPRYWTAYAHALRAVGRREECIAAHRKAIALEPGQGQSWWGLADLKTIRLSSGDIDLMRTQLARKDLPGGERVYLQFALAAALDCDRKFESSFKEYVEANALRRAQLPYDADETTKIANRIKRQFGPDFFRRHEGMGSESREPIFIVGLARSGSTLVEQILSRHSRIEGAGELPCLPSVVESISLSDSDEENAQDEAAPLAFEASALRSWGERYVEFSKSFRRLDRPLFTDKLPMNFHLLGLLSVMLPKARIIDVRRHPVACCFSNFKQQFPAGIAQSYGLSDIGRYYHDYVDVMAHYDAVLPGRIYRVFYEDLVREPERQIRALVAYCGVPFEEACLGAHESDRAVLTVSSEQVRQPIYDDANDSWRHYEQWLAPLKAALGPVLTAYPGVPDGFGQ